MNLRRDYPLNPSDLQRVHDRYALPLAVLGFVAAGLRLARLVVR